MDKDPAKLVRKLFIQKLAEELPQFEPQGGVGKLDLPGWRSFIWSVAEDLHFFVGLCVNHPPNTVIVEGGWNWVPEYPKGTECLSTATITLPDLARKQALFRKGGGASVLEKEADVEAQVAAALEAIKTGFVPLFALRAQKRGITVDL